MRYWIFVNSPIVLIPNHVTRCGFHTYKANTDLTHPDQKEREKIILITEIKHLFKFWLKLKYCG